MVMWLSCYMDVLNPLTILKSNLSKPFKRETIEQQPRDKTSLKNNEQTNLHIHEKITTMKM